MLKIAAFLVVIVMYAGAQPCGKFEKYVQASDPEGTCANPKPKPGPKGPPKCQCLSGCVRHKSECIPVQQCPVETTMTEAGVTSATTRAASAEHSTTPFVVGATTSPNKGPKCDKFEKYVEESEPEGTCASPKPKSGPKGPPKCQCVSGCVRHKQKCIPVQQCPVEAITTTASDVTTSATTSSTAAPSTVTPSADLSTTTAVPSTTAAAPSIVASTTTAAPSTDASTTTAAPSTDASTTTAAPSTDAPTTTAAPSTDAPTTTAAPSTDAPTTTAAPSTTTAAPSTDAPTTTAAPSTIAAAPSTVASTTTAAPSTDASTTTAAPSTDAPTTTASPSTDAPTTTTAAPSTDASTTTTAAPTNDASTSTVPSTAAPSTTKKPKQLKCLQYLSGVCKSPSPLSSARCSKACKMQGMESGVCGKLNMPASRKGGSFICICV